MRETHSFSNSGNKRLQIWIAVGGMVISAAGMLVATAGRLPPVAGAIPQEIIDAPVVANALRVALTPRPLTDFQVDPGVRPAPRSSSRRTRCD